MAVALGLLVAALSASPAGSQGGDGCPPNTNGKNPIQSNDPIIYGSPESDHICGGPGPNVIVGGLLDDDIYGGGGNDVIIGGHGTDVLNGQSGNDWLRGGDNDDVNTGGDGIDTVSFADLMPVGNDPRGVLVNLPGNYATIGDWSNPVNGFTDALHGIENVVGTAFDDDVTAAVAGTTTIYGGAGNDALRGTNGDNLRGEQGVDTCFNNGAQLPSCSDAGEAQQPRPAGAVAYGEVRGRDRGVVVLGSAGSDSLTLAKNGSQVRVSNSAGSLASGGSCQGAGPVDCAPASDDLARYVVAWGDDGNDTIGFGSGFDLGPGAINGNGVNGGTVDVNGGNGSDTLDGAVEDELLFSGESGNDALNGGPGADALISEGSGGDSVHAGGSNDQIVTDNACAGHDLWGEGGTDIVGFARQVHVAPEPNPVGVYAQLAATGGSQQAWAIRGDDTMVTPCSPSTIRGGGEILEGTERHDVLFGNGEANTIWGRTADDTVDGNGGDDRVYGHTGNDTVIGGDGNDWLYGGDGVDSLRARDGFRDNEINCGGGPNDGDPYARRDPNLDPPGISCEDPTQTFLTVNRTLHGQPGYASVSGNVLNSEGEAVAGYVNVNFQKLVNGSWVTESSAHPTLVNGHYEVRDWMVGGGQWRVRAVFPPGQSPYVESESGYHEFQIRDGVQLVARHSGKCLDVNANSTANGAAVQQWDCQPPTTSQNQVFSMVPQAWPYFQIVARHSGKCVDVSNVSQDPGAALQQYDCLGAGQANQIWQWDQIAPGSQYVQFKATHSGQCMDVLGGGGGNGARATQWPCIGGQLNQHWDVRPVDSAPIPTQTYLTVDQELHGQHGYVSVSGNVKRGDLPMSGYVNVNFEKLVNGNWQLEHSAHPVLGNGHYEVNNWGVGGGQWRVRAVYPSGQGNFAQSESNYHYFEIKSGYRLIARHSDKCISLSANQNFNGNALLQWACSPSPNPGDGQVFTLVPHGGNEYSLRINSTGNNPGKCIDVTNVSYDNGAWLQAWDCYGPGQTNQVWRKIPIAGQPPYVAFQAKHSGKCADVSGISTANGARLNQWDCHWGGNQQWTLQPVN